MNGMLEKTSTFLFPCIVEYTLITAGILFTMWSSTVRTRPPPLRAARVAPSVRAAPRNRYSVDCNQASKGLFAGIIVGVLTVVGIILFFVFIDQDAGPDGLDDQIAVLTGEIMEILLNSMGLATTVYCMYQFAVHFNCHAEEKVKEKRLTDALLYVCMVNATHGYFTLEKSICSIRTVIVETNNQRDMVGNTYFTDLTLKCIDLV